MRFSSPVVTEGKRGGGFVECAALLLLGRAHVRYPVDPFSLSLLRRDPAAAALSLWLLGGAFGTDLTTGRRLSVIFRVESAPT